jgi:bifunctional DNA-binding transcriptional regulator/antitoxin component of YhaV-PrlF toxin-antitoxin module
MAGSGAWIREQLLHDTPLDDNQLAEAARAKFGGKTRAGDVAWNRSKLRKEGKLPPAPRKRSVIGTQERAAMDQIGAGLTTKSSRIRALDKAGYERADIARYLNVRYQHVHNVLAQSIGTNQDKATAAESPPPQEWTQVSPDGRLIIPASYRQLLGLETGGPLLMLVEGSEVRLLGRDAALRRAQAMFAPFVRKGERLSDELIADRRAEVAIEQGND